MIRRDTDCKIAQQGLSVELDSHWAAEDEVLSLQAELDQVSIQLKESEEIRKSLDTKLAAANQQRKQTALQLDTVQAQFQGDISNLKRELERKLHLLSGVESSNKVLINKVSTLENDLQQSQKLAKRNDLELRKAEKLASRSGH